MKVVLASSAQDSLTVQPDLLEMLAGGITSVLDVSGQNLAWIGRSAASMPAPRIFSTGQPLRGAAVSWSSPDKIVPFALANNDKEARQAVRQAQQQGAGMIYLDANLESGPLKNALEEARTLEMVSAGTMLATSFEDAARAGIHVIENLMSLLTASAGGGDREMLARLWSKSQEALYGPEGAALLFKTWQKVEPQKNLRRKLQLLTDNAVFLMPMLALETGRLTHYGLTANVTEARQLQEKYHTILRLAFELQVPLLAGSGYNAYRHWRPTLHEELEAWVAAGMEPRFALEAATINAGHALRQSNALGQIAEGMIADLVVVEEHPFAKISTLRRPWLVLREGRPFSQQELSARINPHHLSRREILAVLEWQERAWNDGDLPRFMAGYWQNDSTLFASGGNYSRGWQATLERYKKGYETKDKMGQLTFTVFQLDFMGRDWAKVLGEWKLALTPQDQRGLFTLIFQHLPEGWCVVHDHTSSAPAEPASSK
jgi:hypothetical protein